MSVWEVSDVLILSTRPWAIEGIGYGSLVPTPHQQGEGLVTSG